MSKVLIRNGVVAASKNTVLPGHDVLIDGERIVSIAPNISAPGAEEIDATGAIVMPGMVDTHIHMWHYPLREIGARLWGHRIYTDVITAMREVVDPPDIFEATRECGLQLISRGVTGAVDFLHATVSSEHAYAALDAHRQTGQRVLFAYGMQLGYPIPNQRIPERPWAERLDDFGSLRAHAAQLDGSLVDVALGLSEPNTESFMDEIEFARGRKARMTFHQNIPGFIGQLHNRGLLGPDILPVHGNSSTDEELRWMAEAGMPLSITPECEIAVGRSMTIVSRALKAGLKVGTGIDSPSRAPLDMFAQLKLFYTIGQLIDASTMRESGRSPLDASQDPMSGTVEDIFNVGTKGGAQAMGLGDTLGTLTEGALADVIVVRPDDAPSALVDPLAHVILGAPTAAEVRAVVINGEVRKRDGNLVGERSGDERSEASRALTERILARTR
jgi:cytosine/adenosine deaminase-related metal-dependent hydrolase